MNDEIGRRQSRWYVVSAAATETHDLGWLQRHLPEDGTVRLDNVTARTGVLTVAGPRSRELLRRLTRDDLSPGGFPFFRCRELVDFADFCIACCPYTYRTALEGLPPEEQAEKAAMVWATTDFTRLGGLARRPHAGFNVGYIGTVDFKKIHPRFVAMSAR